MATTSEDRIYERVCTLVNEMIELRLRARGSVPVPPRSLTRALKQGNVTLRTLVRVADSLGYDIYINARERSRAEF